jgi:hypothetical protein
MPLRPGPAKDQSQFHFRADSHEKKRFGDTRLGHESQSEDRIESGQAKSVSVQPSIQIKSGRVHLVMDPASVSCN